MLIINFQPDTYSFITLRQAIGEITEEPRKYISEPVNAEYGQWLNHDVYIDHLMIGIWLEIGYVDGMMSHIRCRRKPATVRYILRHKNDLCV